MSERRYYAIAAQCENTPNDRAIALLVKAHILHLRDFGPQAEIDMWLGIARERNWLDAEDESDIKHILESE